MDFTQAIPFWLFVILAALGVIGMFLSLRRDIGVKTKTSNEPSTKPSNKESGNVLFAIFGALALVGVLSASMMTFMKGPLATSIKLTKMNTAESQMTIGAQVAVMATAAQANNGDCDLDGYVEPLEWRTATTEPKPTGGGLVPLSLGISKKDPWGTEYGYCVWNHGPTLTGSGCNANMLNGYNSNANTVVALISAGPDKAFTTTCRTFAVADVVANGVLTDLTDLPLVSKAAETDDDIITSFTYQEATGASGGLWNLKAADPSTAVINKKIETTGSASFAGGILLPDKSLITCDATTAGIMAKSGTTGIEMCNGTSWTAISGGAAGGGLVLTPNVRAGMNIVGTCGTAACYSSNVTFTVTNNLSPAATSVALVTTLSDTAHFEFVSNNCSGQTLAAAATCQMVVRAKSTGNVSYAGTLNVTGNNSPLAMLDGTAASFPGCNSGGQTTGGYYVACGVSGIYNLIVTPSGCTGGNTNPTCAGGPDTLALSQTSNNLGGSTSIISGCCVGTGAQNTANLIGYSGGVYTFDATSWCSGLVYGGFSDWFLPSLSELQSYLYPNRAAVGFATVLTTGYWSSTEQNFGNNYWYLMVSSTGGNNAGGGFSNPGYVRCMRRDPAVIINATSDTTPVTMTFNASYGNPAEIRTSTAATIYGVTAPINVSIGGGSGAQFSISGGAYRSSAATATNGDTITLQATSPALGQESIVTLTTGSTTTNWLVRTPGNNIIRVFTTSAIVAGNAVSDATCTARASAAGLPGAWMGVYGSAVGDSVANRLPWNWKFLKNMNGGTVATSPPDFMDGTISASMNYTETGGVPGGSLVWTGLGVSGVNPSCGYQSCGTGGTTCTSWTSNAGGYGLVGDSTSTVGGGYFYAGNLAEVGCSSSTRRMLCMETNAAGTDLDPDAVAIRPQVTFASGGTGTSNTVTITGVTDAVTVTIAPSAGTATIIKNGAPVGAMTTTAGLNETVAFTLTAPLVLGTKNTATITLGPDTYTWWVGYADSAKEAKVFVTSAGINPAMGGLSGADSICNSYAQSSPYGLSTNWKAMLSSSSVDMADRIPWNWGTLKTVTGVTVVDGGYTDLLDGTLDSQMNISSAGVIFNGQIHTGSGGFGMKKAPGGCSGGVPICWWIDWTISGCSGHQGVSGNSGVINSQFLDFAAFSCGQSAPIYCIEDVDNAVLDTTPNTISPTYAIQVATSSRQTSSAVLIGGMSSGATTTLSVTATGGTPTFKVNGGAEVTSGTVTNGASVVFLMDAPAVGNSSNKMTINAGATIVGYWRVWTGDTTGTAVKRVFVTSTGTTYSTNRGGVTGTDSICQTRATANALGGTWKAIVSGHAEADWAVNRIGYNWSTLRRLDGVDVVLAGNIWNTVSVPLLASISIGEDGTSTVSVQYVRTNTNRYGSAIKTSGNGACINWSYYVSGYPDSSYYLYNGTSGVTGYQWIDNGIQAHSTNGDACAWVMNLYCIEQ